MMIYAIISAFLAPDFDYYFSFARRGFQREASGPVRCAIARRHFFTRKIPRVLRINMRCRRVGPERHAISLTYQYFAEGPQPTNKV